MREHPELKTVVLDRHTGATLWQSDPDIPARYEVLAVDATAFYALATDLSVSGDVLSAHKEKDDAWTAFYEAIKEPVGNDIILLRDTMSVQTVLASSDEDRYRLSMRRDGGGPCKERIGRVASRPGYPAEPAARSRPCGRVSLAPPLASSLRAPLAKKQVRQWGNWTLLPT